MLRINEVKVPLGASPDDIKRAAAKIIGVKPDDFLSFSIARESLDSRKKSDIFMIYSVDVRLDAFEEEIASPFTPNKVLYFNPVKYEIPENHRKSDLRPVIVGFGPAGMFCGLLLAERGLRPIIIERGHDVDRRNEDVKTFWTCGKLNTDSNVQFGEGGAGTFSDGKLTTGIKDGRVGVVLETLKKYGAPGEITYSARPHIGTDLLGGVVKNIRSRIIELGGEVHFGCRLDDIIIYNGSIQGICCSDEENGSLDLEADTLILAIGHSARDTVEMLYKKGLHMEQKAFSVGTRIEHPQELINKAQYGAAYKNPALPVADYKLSNHPPHGRGAYTFCMCPGGTVVCASSEENRVVVNGMSVYARDGENANTAILVGIEPDRLPGDHPLEGMKLQRELESRAYELGGSSYAAPCQLVGDFLGGKKSTRLGAVRPSCPTGVTPSDMRLCLPGFVCDEIGEAITQWDKKLHGYALPDAVLTFPESRSSSPVRILRNDVYESENVIGIYPCGEGAGYAGGIVSAAVDGMRVAESILLEEEW